MLREQAYIIYFRKNLRHILSARIQNFELWIFRRFTFSDHWTLFDSNQLKPKGGTSIQCFVSKPTLFTLEKTCATFYQPGFKILSFESSGGLLLATTGLYMTHIIWNLEGEPAFNASWASLHYLLWKKLARHPISQDSNFWALKP